MNSQQQHRQDTKKFVDLQPMFFLLFVKDHTRQCAQDNRQIQYTPGMKPEASHNEISVSNRHEQQHRSQWSMILLQSSDHLIYAFIPMKELLIQDSQREGQ